LSEFGAIWSLHPEICTPLSNAFDHRAEATILQELREFMFVTGILVHIVEQMMRWIFVVIAVLDFGQKNTK
jgi:hypothetical protein